MDLFRMLEDTISPLGEKNGKNFSSKILSSFLPLFSFLSYVVLHCYLEKIDAKIEFSEEYFERYSLLLSVCVLNFARVIHTHGKHMHRNA